MEIQNRTTFLDEKEKKLDYLINKKYKLDFVPNEIIDDACTVHHFCCPFWFSFLKKCRSYTLNRMT